MLKARWKGERSHSSLSPLTVFPHQRNKIAGIMGHNAQFGCPFCTTPLKGGSAPAPDAAAGHDSDDDAAQEGDDRDNGEAAPGQPATAATAATAGFLDSTEGVEPDTSGSDEEDAEAAATPAAVQPTSLAAARRLQFAAEAALLVSNRAKIKAVVMQHFQLQYPRKSTTSRAIQEAQAHVNAVMLSAITKAGATGKVPRAILPPLASRRDRQATEVKRRGKEKLNSVFYFPLTFDRRNVPLLRHLRLIKAPASRTLRRPI